MLFRSQDFYVDDAFGAAHREHASIVGPPAHLPSAAGRLLAKEVEVLGGLLDAPRKPFICVLGGSKVSDKLAVIDALLPKVDKLLIGGGMCLPSSPPRVTRSVGRCSNRTWLTRASVFWPKLGTRSSCPTISPPYRPTVVSEAIRRNEVAKSVKLGCRFRTVGRVSTSVRVRLRNCRTDQLKLLFRFCHKFAVIV